MIDITINHLKAVISTAEDIIEQLENGNIEIDDRSSIMSITRHNCISQKSKNGWIESSLTGDFSISMNNNIYFKRVK